MRNKCIVYFRVHMFYQIIDFSLQQPMTDALEALSNIDHVTITHNELITSYDDNAGTLEVRYSITFDGDCVRGNIPTGDLAASCHSSTASFLADVECR